jgi:hypothetical protein
MPPTSHAQQRAIERLGISPDVELGPWFQSLIKTIRAGRANFVHFGYGETMFYDVPSDCEVYRGVVRVLVSPSKDFVMTVLPKTFRGKAFREVEGKRKRDYFRGLRIEGDDDGYQMDQA